MACSSESDISYVFNADESPKDTDDIERTGNGKKNGVVNGRNGVKKQNGHNNEQFQRNKKNGYYNGFQNGNGRKPIPNGILNRNGKTHQFSEHEPSSRKYLVKRLSKISRNPFLNYVRQLRMERDFYTVKELTKTAGAEWKNLSEETKREYIEEAMTVDPPLQAAPFFKLGEHKLGPSMRRNLAKFKVLMDDAVEKNLREIQNKQIKDSYDSD